MRRRLALIPALAGVALLALTACTTEPGGDDGGAGDPDGSGGTGDTGGTPTTAECLQGSWALDADHQLTQLQENFTSTGLDAQAVLVEGGVTLTVEGDRMTYDSNVTYTMTVESGGLALMVVQTQFGQSSGSFSESGGRVVFESWNTGIDVENTISADGQTMDMPIEIPADMGTGVAMGVDCSGDTLTTTPEASPFTGVWARVG